MEEISHDLIAEFEDILNAEERKNHCIEDMIKGEPGI